MNLDETLGHALALQGQGKLRDALAKYDEVLTRDPAHAHALHLSGVALYQSGNFAAAIARIRASLGIQPNAADAWSNLALALDASGNQEAAIEALEHAVRHAPLSPQVFNNLAAIELDLGRAADAERSARRAVEIDARYATGWLSLALALQAQGRTIEALDAATRAAAIAPEQVTHAGLKAQLEDAIGAPDRARKTLESALARTPLATPLRFELAAHLERTGDRIGAAGAYEQVLRLDPANGSALSELVFLRRQIADWHDLPALEHRFRRGVANAQPLLSPFVMLSQASTRAEQRRCAETWCRTFAAPGPITRRRRLSKGRLRIGYLSGDFHTHATSFLAAGLFEQHDRSRFVVIGFSTGPDDGSLMRRRIERAFDKFHDLRGLDPEQVAAAIRADAVDLLIDLKGHTAGAHPHVLALRPAPIQAHYLGYPGTLGDGLVDYLIGDRVVTPAEHAGDYAETLVRLPACYQINDRERSVADPLPRTELGLPERGVVLCNFNNTYKLNPAVLDAWATVLREVPDAVLWLLARDGADPAIGNLRREMEARGVEAARLVFATHCPNPQYLALYRVADLFLDTWPYNAHTTASDALWAGCPLLTVFGETFASRVAASLLTAVGLPELIAGDVEAYVGLAVALARDSTARSRLRAHLEGPGRSSPLFDTAATTRALEAAYLTMAEQYRQIARAPIDLR